MKQTNTHIAQTTSTSEAIRKSSKAASEQKISQDGFSSEGGRLIYKPDQYGQDRDQYGRLAQWEDPDCSPEGLKRHEEWAKRMGLL